MPSINEWVDKNARLPLVRLVTVSLGIILAYFIYFICTRYAEQMSRIELARESISLGVQQSNRPLIEATIMSLLGDSSVLAAAVCSGGSAEISYPLAHVTCRQETYSLRSWSVRKPLVGVHGKDVEIILSPLSAFGPLLFIIAISVLALAAIIGRISGISGRLRTEILIPLANGLNTGASLSIGELETLRLNNLERTTLLSAQAASEARLQLSTQVAHDIRSPVYALDAALKNIPQIPELQRVMVRHAVNRIRDVANSLLEKNRQQPGPASTAAAGANSAGEPLGVHLLSTLIDPVVIDPLPADD